MLQFHIKEMSKLCLINATENVIDKTIEYNKIRHTLMIHFLCS